MFYLIKKPLGISSNLVAKIMKRVLNEDKIGFAGTLDPLATGVMIIGTAGSSRLFPLMEEFTKTYITTVRLDGTTVSYDLEHPIIPIEVSKEIQNGVTQAKIQNIIDTHFTGKIDQIPPSYSANWINGQRAYDLMRKGKSVTIAAKEREIYSMKIITYEWPKLVCEITVSHGTYIRSIARDLGDYLSTGGYLEVLERIAIGHIDLNSPRNWMQHNDIEYRPLKHSELFLNIPIIEMSQDDKKHLKLGSTPLKSTQENGKYFINYADESFGLLEAKDGYIYPLKNGV